MNRISIIQHVPYETPGCIEDWINKKSYPYKIIKPYKGEPLPQISDFEWLIIMGGPMSVHDTDMFSWLAGEKIFIKNAVSSGKVVIGICLGAQLIAESLGSRVYRNEAREIGWFPVTRIPDKTDSGLLNKFDYSETVFHWHGETFEIPYGASHEFSSDACRNQGFIYGQKVLGLQFHVELTDPLLEGMISNGKDELLPGEYIQNAEQLLVGAVNIKKTVKLMFSILDEFDRQQLK